MEEKTYSTTLKELGFNKLRQQSELATSKGNFGYVRPVTVQITSTFAFDENGGCWVLHETIDLTKYGFIENEALTNVATTTADLARSSTRLQ